MPRPGSRGVFLDERTLNSWEKMGLFSSRCTIKEKGAGRDTAGQKNGVLVAVAGMQDIPCRVGVMAMVGAGAGENEREVEGTYSTHTLGCYLKGYFPDILETHTAVIDEKPYDIEQVEHASDHSVTRLRLEKRS
jgi:hypothetical protein